MEDMEREKRMVTIRLIRREDFQEVLEMMKVFYASEAVLHKASEEVLRRDIEDCLGDMPFIEGYVFEDEGKIAGYAMVAKAYTTEYGGICIWVEDLYMKPEYRHRGLGSFFFAFLEKEYEGKAVRFKLEVEEENNTAIEAYKKNGYQISPYFEMTKEMS